MVAVVDTNSDLFIRTCLVDDLHWAVRPSPAGQDSDRGGLIELHAEGRSISSMQRKRVYSHAEAEAILRTTGYSTEQITNILGRFPDPIDTQRDGQALFELGISLGQVTDRMGGSP